MYHLGRVIDHIHLRVSDLEASRRFYRAICDALHLEGVFEHGPDHFVIDEIYVDAASDYVSRIHLAFQARSREDVDAFHRLALEAGGRSNGAPGLRPYHDRYYAAFVFDPDGNNIEAVCDAPSFRSAASVVVERT
ncbi:Predicted lactoylglutathione lyase [Rhizobium sp. NFR07]|uniref:VOC family protein n=1 Tax=Rhizobium sp. NFR07 TaxID=1566262 RepID=UPI0008F1CAFE|nr:VOC family protein [Rhizobium sp. NFR07]SFB61816.1 Predicted lactoylglutathione lyase [Rhizobium sp. NFR07]